MPQGVAADSGSGSRPYIVINPVYVHERFRQRVMGRGWGFRDGPAYRPSPRAWWNGAGWRADRNDP